MMAEEMNHKKKLPFPTRPLTVRGGMVEEYIIPDEMKQEVLNQLYPFAEPAPSLGEELYDLCRDPTPASAQRGGEERDRLILFVTPTL
jgi:hypothetical protein